jgi:hypothetical protein
LLILNTHYPRQVLTIAVNIDIDCMDPAEAKRFLPFKPHDQTSNQRLVYEQMVSPENHELLLRTVKVGKDEGWEVILARMVGRLYPPGFLCITQQHSLILCGLHL